MKKQIKVVFENGDYLFTMINATEQEIRNYYIGKYFNLGRCQDNMQKCIDIEIL